MFTTGKSPAKERENKMELAEAVEIAKLPTWEYAKHLRNLLRHRSPVKFAIACGHGSAAGAVFITPVLDSSQTAEEQETHVRELAAALGYYYGATYYKYFIISDYERVRYLMAAAGWSQQYIEAVWPMPDNSADL